MSVVPNDRPGLPANDTNVQDPLTPVDPFAFAYEFAAAEGSSDTRSQALFVSDLHLSADTLALNEAFLLLLEQAPTRTQRLYILGDLFEVWVGDDTLIDKAERNWVAPIVIALRECSSRIRVQYIHGNRDFLLGEAFTRLSGMEYLPQEHIVQIGDERILLAHGDLYCTDDVAYQEFRLQTRDVRWQNEFLRKPYAQRVEIARGMREQSEQNKANNRRSMAQDGNDIMDVNPEAVRAAMLRNYCTTMIHGHTHRPAVHEVDLSDAQTKRTGQRIVLRDWSVSTPS